jgi:hypothetical protein
MCKEDCKVLVYVSVAVGVYRGIRACIEQSRR